jgi:membrane protease YdiL (CAAX protease family)
MPDAFDQEPMPLPEEDHPPAEDRPQEDEQPPARGFTLRKLLAFSLALLSWGVVVALVALSLIRGHPKPTEAEDAGTTTDVQLVLFRSQARAVLGGRELQAMFGQADDAKAFKDVQNLFAGSIDQRLRFVVLAGELAGPEEALKYLERLDTIVREQGASYSANQKFQRDTLYRLYRDYQHLRYDAPSVSPADRTKLREQLEWFGELALAPAGRPAMVDGCVAIGGGPAGLGIRAQPPYPEKRQEILESSEMVSLLLMAVVAGALGGACLGFMGLIGFVILAVLGLLRSGVRTGRSPAGVYVETFALWIIAFEGLSLVAHFIPASIRLVTGGVLELCSLLVVFWPVLRGVPWKQVREDIGWTRGRQPALEPVAGISCYVMALPVVLGAILIVMAVTYLQKTYFGQEPSADNLHPSEDPTHPIVGPLMRGDLWIRLQILFLASVVAPIVEETFFRGVFYRHLREFTCKAGRVVSIAVAALVSSTIFAVIHPVPLMGMPMLVGLALGFVLAREWRGTLIPGMVAHGLHNGFLLVFNIITLS